MQNIRNDDMNEGDMYVVKSDGWHGESPWTRRPAECYMSTNFGDRLAAVHLVEWWCEKTEGEPFLAVYDNCNGEKTNLLVCYAYLHCVHKNRILKIFQQSPFTNY